MVPQFQNAANPNSAVRIGWQSFGQPAQKASEDVAYVRCYEVDDLMNKTRDMDYVNGPTVFTQVVKYTRVWEVFWSVYGPNSFDNARQIRTRLWDQDIHDLFAASQLYFVAEVSAPVRVPYEQDGQWWDRADLKVRFNEFVTELSTAQYVESVEIILETAAGVEVADFTVEE